MFPNSPFNIRATIELKNDQDATVTFKNTSTQFSWNLKFQNCKFITSHEHLLLQTICKRIRQDLLLLLLSSSCSLEGLLHLRQHYDWGFSNDRPGCVLWQGFSAPQSEKEKYNILMYKLLSTNMFDQGVKGNENYQFWNSFSISN